MLILNMFKRKILWI